MLLLGEDTIPSVKVCTTQPLHVSEHGTFIINLSSLKSTSDVKCDDIGVWNNNSNDKFYFHLNVADDLTIEVTQAVEKDGSRCAVLKREYYTLKHDKDFRKRIDLLYCKYFR